MWDCFRPSSPSAKSHFPYSQLSFSNYRKHGFTKSFFSSLFSSFSLDLLIFCSPLLSCRSSSLVFRVVFSSLSSCLLSSSRVFLLYLIVSSLLSLAFSVSLSVSVSVCCCCGGGGGCGALLCVVLCCGVCVRCCGVCAVWCVVCRVSVQTSPCIPAPRAHVFQHVRVVPAYTGAF